MELTSHPSLDLTLAGGEHLQKFDIGTVDEILATGQVSDTEEDDFSETAEHLAEIKEAPASIDYHPNQTFPFLKDLDISTVYRWDKIVGDLFIFYTK